MVQPMSLHNIPTKRPKNGESPLAERLELFRLQRGLTYDKLATLIGCAKGTAYAAAQGKLLSKRLAYKIEQFLSGVSHAA